MQTQHTIIPAPLCLAGRYLSDTAHIDALPALDTHELAWAAGFFDGEGCTYLTRAGGQGIPVPCTEVNQVKPGVLVRFQAAVGGLGSMRLRPDLPKRRPNPVWSFYTRNWRGTQAVLTLLWPYLENVKREQAAMVFDEYRREAVLHPRLGQPHPAQLWTPTSCPFGHTDVYVLVRRDGKGTLRRCRVCRREGTRVPRPLRWNLEV